MTSQAGQIAGRIGAVIFDTGGTVFDWHGGVCAAMARIGGEEGCTADWPALTKDWRRLSTGMVNDGLPAEGGRAGIDMDEVLRITLDEVLSRHEVPNLRQAARQRMVQAWHDLDAWQDVGPGLERLRRRFVISPFTILNTRLVIDASRRSGLSWDCVISCEMIGIYKTLPGAYETAARWLALPHERILLATTHNNDLRAGHSYGFPTAYIHRHAEWGDIPSPDPEPDPLADIVCEDFSDLADQLGCH